MTLSETHIFSADIEEYFQVSAFEPYITRASWSDRPSRVEQSTDRLLDLLARHGASGTFFTLGWIARQHPHVVKKIVGAGHELASHGFWHRRIWSLTPTEFRQDVRDARAILEDVSGSAVRGYRAPTFSITPRTEWALDVLIEEGHHFDSSIFPVRRPGYGFPGASTRPHLIRRPAGELLELPIATLTLGGVRVPAGGGGYLRQLPYRLIHSAFRELSTAGSPGMFYIHPWELDPEQPRIPCPWLTSMRHYRGLERTAPRLERLLSTFRFTSVARRFGGEFEGRPFGGAPPHTAAS
jgi:polysaccharide deacetylase family protein (PEP-CTERM system associated)